MQSSSGQMQPQTAVRSPLTTGFTERPVDLTEEISSFFGGCQSFRSRCRHRALRQLRGPFALGAQVEASAVVLRADAAAEGSVKAVRVIAFEGLAGEGGAGRGHGHCLSRALR